MKNLPTKYINFTTLEIANSDELYWIQSDDKGTICAEDLHMNVEDAINVAVELMHEGQTFRVTNLMESDQEQLLEEARDQGLEVEMIRYDDDEVFICEVEVEVVEVEEEEKLTTGYPFIDNINYYLYS
jgi:hypothetical protein